MVSQFKVDSLGISLGEGSLGLALIFDLLKSASSPTGPLLCAGSVTNGPLPGKTRSGLLWYARFAQGACWGRI